MLSQKNRLRTDKDIKKVLKQGRRIKTPFLRIHTLKNNLENSRFAVVVSTKTAKRATVRNVIKRRIRESLKKHMDLIAKGFDVVIFARSESVIYKRPKEKNKKTPPETARKFDEFDKDISQFIQIML